MFIEKGDETWIHHYIPSIKWQSAVWKQSDESVPKNSKLHSRQIRSIFWDWKSTLQEEYLPYNNDEGITQHFYFDTLLCLRNTIQWKWPRLLSRGLVLIDHNATLHKAALVKGLLADFRWSIFLHHYVCRIFLSPTSHCSWSWRMLCAESGFKCVGRRKHLRSHFLPTLTLICTTMHYKCWSSITINVWIDLAVM